jgi:cell division septal protein FtsQ
MNGASPMQPNSSTQVCNQKTFKQSLKGALFCLILFGVLFALFLNWVNNQPIETEIEIDYLTISGNKITLSDSGKVTTRDYSDIDSVKYYIIDEVVYIVR